MDTHRSFMTSAAVCSMIICTLLLAPRPVYSHCDSLDGPVILTAKAALENKDVTPVLKWISKDEEDEIRNAFSRTLIVRETGKEARELADMYFFETLVRLHREGEGAVYTGLKPAGTQEPIVRAADKALETGKVDEIKKHITEVMTSGIQKRFNEAFETKKHADDTVEAGRKFVEAYVEYVHYVEGIFLTITSESSHHAEPGESNVQSVHEH